VKGLPKLLLLDRLSDLAVPVAEVVKEQVGCCYCCYGFPARDFLTGCSCKGFHARDFLQGIPSVGHGVVVCFAWMEPY
jgi:hypothetical protein